jgi:hypothetical protein
MHQSKEGNPSRYANALLTQCGPRKTIMREYMHQVEETIARAVDERMSRMEMLQIVEDRKCRERDRTRPAETIHPYLTVSCEAGAGGSEVARLTAERLGWKYFNRELLDCVARMSHVPPELLESMDEKGHSWIADIFGHLFEPTGFHSSNM